MATDMCNWFPLGGLTLVCDRQYDLFHVLVYMCTRIRSCDL